MTKLERLVLLLLICAPLTLLTSCDSNAENAVENAADAVENAADDIGDLGNG